MSKLSLINAINNAQIINDFSEVAISTVVPIEFKKNKFENKDQLYQSIRASFLEDLILTSINMKGGNKNLPNLLDKEMYS
ncbi:hypothetical protein [Mycoplasma sp. Ms02]|uniref:hypothetical protein n=1 Tax=Mycoplasma sp. Ms02 TaxID=353851 RepID=UPI001C890E1B|nr:hypothetical protein [Mycoplasma sp. Ms02]QZE12666.1 hypothetical protein K4L35_01625 [Mycoplasma sp. Ms02]